MRQEMRSNTAEAMTTIEQGQEVYIIEVPPLPPLPTLRALDLHSFASAVARLGKLTDREYSVLVPVLSGRSNSEIAEEIGMSLRGVKFHVSNILRKLRVSQRCELLRFFF